MRISESQNMLDDTSGPMHHTPRYVVLLGAPGAGKGTQARLLSGALGVPHISSGDLFRENLREESELGLLAKSYIVRGELVHDDVTVRMVMERLARPDCGEGAILDGFPRTLAQAAALDRGLARQGAVGATPCKISAALLIQVSDETVVKRLSGRRVCRDCQAMYHTELSPPSEPARCDECGGLLYQRPDDQPETVRNRLLVYYKQTAPLMGYYFAHGVLAEVDGEQGVEAVQADLLAVVSDNGHS
jgi:adenylate kinase